MILVNTDYISGKNLEMLGLVKGKHDPEQKYWKRYYTEFQNISWRRVKGIQ